MHAWNYLYAFLVIWMVNCFSCKILNHIATKIGLKQNISLKLDLSMRGIKTWDSINPLMSGVN